MGMARGYPARSPGALALRAEQIAQRARLGRADVQLALQGGSGVARPPGALPGGARERLRFPRQLVVDAEVLEPLASSRQLAELLARPLALQRLTPEAIAQAIDFASEPALQDHVAQLGGVDPELRGDLARRAAVLR